MKASKNELILEAALQQFCEHGFSASRIADIAKKAGVGKGTIYEYYHSKEELLLKCCIHSCQQVDNSISELPQRLEAQNSVQRVSVTLIALLTTLFSKNGAEYKLFYELSVLTANNSQMKSLMQKEFQIKMAQWNQMALFDYQAGLEEGLFRELGNAQDLAEFIVATVDGLIWQLQWQSESKLNTQAKRLSDIYCQLIMKEPQRLEEYLK